jgi:hypothetical protein
MCLTLNSAAECAGSTFQVLRAVVAVVGAAVAIVELI